MPKAMPTKNEAKLRKIVSTRLGTRIRTIDVTMIQTLDPHFLVMFQLYWLISQPLNGRTGKDVVIELIRTGLMTKFNRDQSLTKEKLKTFCQMFQISGQELLDLINEECQLSIEDHGISADDLSVESTSIDELII